MRIAALLKWVRRFGADRGGNIVVTTALALPVLLGTVGLGTEVGSWYSSKRAMQNAADSAVIAAATRADTQVFDEEAKAVATEYGYQDGTDGVTVTAAANIACPDGSGPICYRVVVSRPQPLLLAQIVGYQGDATVGGAPAKLIEASAIAKRGNSSRDYCVLALGASGVPVALRGNGSPKASLTGCTVMSNTGANCNGHDLDADYGDAHGINLGCGNQQRSGVDVVADPYVGLASNIPAVNCPGGYPVAPQSKKDPQLPLSNRLNGYLAWSGVHSFCGDVQLIGPTIIQTDANGAVLLIRDGTLDLNNYRLSTSNGSALTVIFTGTNGSRRHTPSGTGYLDIAAPKQGTWSGVAVYQNPSIPSGTAVDINYTGNDPVWDVTGLIYLPKASVTMSGVVNKATEGKSCFALVVDNILINGTAQILSRGECGAAGLSMPASVTVGRGELVG